MSDNTFVWARDTLTGASGPIPRAVLTVFGDRYRADEKHPTHNTLGQLLPTKAAEPKLATKKTVARQPRAAARKTLRKPNPKTSTAPAADETPEEA